MQRTSFACRVDDFSRSRDKSDFKRFFFLKSDLLKIEILYKSACACLPNFSIASIFSLKSFAVSLTSAMSVVYLNI